MRPGTYRISLVITGPRCNVTHLALVDDDLMRSWEVVPLGALYLLLHSLHLRW